VRSELKRLASEEERREDKSNNLSAPKTRTSNRSQQSGPDFLSTVVDLVAAAKKRYPTTFPVVVNGNVNGSPHRNTELIIEKFMDGHTEEVQRLVQEGYRPAADSRPSANLKSPVANSKVSKEQKTPEHLPPPLKITPPVGLPNGKLHICYMNSLLQVLHPIWI
jgi:hypothetical protein